MSKFMESHPSLVGKSVQILNIINKENIMLNIQDSMKELFGNSCYGYCCSYVAEVKCNVKPDIHIMTTDFLNGWNKGWIDDDGFVSKPVQYLASMGLKIKDIRKTSITKLSDLPEGIWIVEFKKTPDSKESHFVVCNRKKVLFDPSGNSITVKVGKPVSYREFII